HVENDEIGPLLIDELLPLLAVAGLDDLVPLRFEDGADAVGQLIIIIDDENHFLLRHYHLPSGDALHALQIITRDASPQVDFHVAEFARIRLCLGPRPNSGEFSYDIAHSRLCISSDISPAAWWSPCFCASGMPCASMARASALRLSRCNARPAW